MTKNYVCRTPYLTNQTSYEHDFWYASVKRWHIHFFKSLIFQVVGEKGQKMVQIDKKFCLSHSVALEPYLIWLWFLVHISKRMTSLAIFFIFSKFWLFGFLGDGGGVKRQKMIHNYQFQSVTLYTLTTVDHIIKIFGTQV